MVEENKIILVKKQDRKIGTNPKSSVYERKLLHRAFFILIFNNTDELLIQKRASNKYYSGFYGQTHAQLLQSRII